MSPDSEGSMPQHNKPEAEEFKPRTGIIDIPVDRIVATSEPELDEEGKLVDPDQVILEWKHESTPKKPSRLDRFLQGRQGAAQARSNWERHQLGAVPTSKVLADGRVIEGPSEIRPGMEEGHRRRPVSGENAQIEYIKDRNDKVIGVKITLKEAKPGTFYEWDFVSTGPDPE